MSRVAHSILWRRQAIDPEAQECLATFLTSGEFPKCHTTRAASEAWLRFAHAYRNIQTVDPENAPGGVPFPRLVYWHSIDRAHDILASYLNRPIEERVDLHRKLGIETGAVLSQEDLESAHGVALARTFKSPVKRRTPEGQLDLDLEPTPPSSPPPPPPPSSTSSRRSTSAAAPVPPSSGSSPPPPPQSPWFCDECNTEHIDPACPDFTAPPSPTSPASPAPRVKAKRAAAPPAKKSAKAPKKGAKAPKKGRRK